jgi:hypothetical protein
MRIRARLAKFLIVALCAAPAAHAGLLAVDGFDYQIGASLNGQNGGAGWSGGWTNPGGLDATISNGLTFGNLAVSGGAVSTAGSQPPNQGSSVATFVRGLNTSLGADNTTDYLSFLLRPDAGAGFYGGINFGGVFVGLSGNQSFYGLEGPVNDISLSSVPAVQDQTVLFVLRLDFLPGNDRLSLYLNPTPGQSEPATPDVVKTDLDVGSVTSFVINNYGGFTTDEIRVGSTFADVTPTATPEPGFGVAVGAILMVWIGLTFRRAPSRCRFGIRE